MPIVSLPFLRSFLGQLCLPEWASTIAKNTGHYLASRAATNSSRYFIAADNHPDDVCARSFRSSSTQSTPQFSKYNSESALPALVQRYPQRHEREWWQGQPIFQGHELKACHEMFCPEEHMPKVAGSSARVVAVKQSPWVRSTSPGPGSCPEWSLPLWRTARPPSLWSLCRSLPRLDRPVWWRLQKLLLLIDLGSTEYAPHWAFPASFLRLAVSFLPLYLTRPPWWRWNQCDWVHSSKETKRKLERYVSTNTKKVKRRERENEKNKRGHRTRKRNKKNWGKQQ